MRVRTGKVIKAQSLVGNQSSLTFNSASANNVYLGVGNGVCLKQNGDYIKNSGLGVNITLDSSHKYLIMMQIIGTLSNNSFHIYYRDDSEGHSLQTTEYKSVDDKAVCAIITGATKFRAAHLYTYSSSFDSTTLASYYFLIDLTAAFGSGNEPTAQQFYSKYNNYLELIATGEEIVIDRGSGKVMTEDSNDDIISCNVTEKMYNYNQYTNSSDSSKWYANTGATKSFSDDIVTFTATATSGRVYQTTSRIIGHKYLASVMIKLTNASQAANSKIRLWLQLVSGQNVSVSANQTTEWQTLSTIFTSAQDITGLSYPTIQDDNTSGWAAIQVKDMMFIDLTEMYGAGYEPTAVEEFKTKFPNDYYGYSPEIIRLTQGMINATPVYGYNQLSKCVSSISSSVWSYQKVGESTFTLSANNTTSSRADCYPINKTAGYSSIPTGHKVICLWDKPIPNTKYIIFNRGNSTYVTVNSNTLGVIIEIIDGATSLMFAPAVDAGNSVPETTVTVNVIDLTDWYGAGSEPSTVAEFKATFPHKFYPYSKKTLLNRYMINSLGNN